MFKLLKLLESPFQGDFILTRIYIQLVPFADSKNALHFSNFKSSRYMTSRGCRHDYNYAIAFLTFCHLKILKLTFF